MTASAFEQSILPAHCPDTLPLWLVSDNTLAQWRAAVSPQFSRWADSCGFKGEKGRVLALPGPEGRPAGAVVGLGALENPEALSLWHLAGVAGKLPALDFRCETSLPAAAATQAALGFAYGEYRFDRYRSTPEARSVHKHARLAAPAGCDVAAVRRTIHALTLARDLVNTPASDMGPAELAATARALADEFGARCQIIEGEALLKQGYPAIHAVGRASSRAPRLIDLRWGEEQHPRVTLVGKGVCFDTGGLDLKPAAGMLLMKKDMGGAACVLGLARMVMDARLPVRLRVLVPAVENSVGGNAFRPGDVLKTRQGISVEIGNTDAEGRLVLCEALTEADSERPALILDMATLTGAARVALGPELPALYGNQEEWVQALLRHGLRQHDPLWHMPLWQPYEEDLGSKVADVNNASASTFAGSIVAALFLRRFVSTQTPWLHVDLFAWNPKDRPGRPAGAEAQCLRAAFNLLQEKFGHAPQARFAKDTTPR